MRDFTKAVDEVLNIMRADKYSPSTVRHHELCYGRLVAHLTRYKQEYSLKAGTEWLDACKKQLKPLTYKKYRLSFFRLDNYMRTGSIDRDVCAGVKLYAFHDDGNSFFQLPEMYRSIAREYYSDASERFSHWVARAHLIGVVNFLTFLFENGCNNPADLSVEILSAYYSKREKCGASQRRQIAGVKQLLAQFYECGYVPRFFTDISFAAREVDMNFLCLPKEQRGNAIYPSKNLENKSAEFLELLKKRGYGRECIGDYEATLNELVRFLEINHLKYAPETPVLLLNCFQSQSAKDLRRQQLRQFDDYLRTGELKSERNYAWKPLQLLSLPEWCQTTTRGFLESRAREGLAKGTIQNSMAGCLRFFKFLVAEGVSHPVWITPELVKKFHDTDPHSTARSRNACAGRVRKLLQYMAEQSLVPKNLYLALSNESAQVRQVVTVLSAEMETAIYDFREKAVTPLELRDSAIVMIGLRMGLRASDIVKLKITDFDLKNRRLSIVQTKTRRAITLPIPTEVGNSVYRYITEGRPRLGEAGYVFVSHSAPFLSVSHAVCRNALIRILSSAGIALPFGQGFHITRRTFATRLLTAKTGIDRIAESLGHADAMNVDVYLAHDEERMRLCALPFTIGGIIA